MALHLIDRHSTIWALSVWPRSSYLPFRHSWCDRHVPPHPAFTVEMGSHELLAWAAFDLQSSQSLLPMWVELWAWDTRPNLCHMLFIHSPIKRHIACFHILLLWIMLQ
jgi:hypothetical protein